MLVDSHCHLDQLDLDVFGGSLDEALDEARSAGVGTFLCVDIDLDNYPAVEAIAARHADVWCSIGEHPSVDFATALDPAFLAERIRNNPRIVAVGECGLDYFRGQEQRDEQLARFNLQLDLALETRLPVIVHTRDAREDTMVCLRRFTQAGGRGVLHCFTESLAMAEEAIELGFMISFSGIITFRNAEALREVVRRIPMSSMLVETDSPYLSPVPHRGKPNRPVRVADVAAMVASERKLSPELIATHTTNNFFALFDRAVPPASWQAVTNPA